MGVDLAADFHLISDEPSVFPNYPGWQDNRHDQSLFSMLVKASNPEIDGGDPWDQQPPAAWPMNAEFGIAGLRPLLMPGHPQNFRVGGSNYLANCAAPCQDKMDQIRAC